MTAQRSVTLFECDAPTCDRYEALGFEHDAHALQPPDGWLVVIGDHAHDVTYAFHDLPCLVEWAVAQVGRQRAES